MEFDFERSECYLYRNGDKFNQIMITFSHVIHVVYVFIGEQIEIIKYLNTQNSKLNYYANTLLSLHNLVLCIVNWDLVNFLLLKLPNTNTN